MRSHKQWIEEVAQALRVEDGCTINSLISKLAIAESSTNSFTQVLQNCEQFYLLSGNPTLVFADFAAYKKARDAGYLLAEAVHTPNKSYIKLTSGNKRHLTAIYPWQLNKLIAELTKLQATL